MTTVFSIINMLGAIANIFIFIIMLFGILKTKEFFLNRMTLTEEIIRDIERRKRNLFSYWWFLFRLKILKEEVKIVIDGEEHTIINKKKKESDDKQ